MKGSPTSRFLAIWFGAFVLLAGRSHAAEPVEIIKVDDKVRVEINGELFTEYHYKDVPRPYFYPVLGPGEVAMTRKWPLEEVAGEEHDHPHHRGLWYAHSSVNGFDFWSEGKGCKIEQQKFLQTSSGKKFGTIRTANNWIASDGTLVCSDVRTIRIFNRPRNERLMDFEITFHAPPDKPVVFGDEKDGSMAIRVAESMRLTHGDGKKAVQGDGHIVMSTGLRDAETWGKRAEWCDYYGPVGDKTVGVAIFDHPSNLRHPTWWHVRDYGLFAANPFGVHDFEKKPKGTGDYTLPAGKTLTFRYRIYFHEGNEIQAKVAEHYGEFIK
jgi:hypothetical protein